MQTLSMRSRRRQETAQCGREKWNARNVAATLFADANKGLTDENAVIEPGDTDIVGGELSSWRQRGPLDNTRVILLV